MRIISMCLTILEASQFELMAVRLTSVNILKGTATNGSMEPVDVISVIHKDHANLAELLNAVERQLAAFERGERPDYDIIQGALDYCLNYPGLYHHPMEDLIMRKLRVRDPVAADAVGDLEADHQALNGETRRFAAVVDDILQEVEVPRETFETTARSFIEHYRAHMEKEEKVFLPAAAKVLSVNDMAEVEVEMGRRVDPLFEHGDSDGARFEALRKNLMDWSREAP